MRKYKINVEEKTIMLQKNELLHGMWRDLVRLSWKSYQDEAYETFHFTNEENLKSGEMVLKGALYSPAEFEIKLMGERKTEAGHTQRWRVHLTDIHNLDPASILEVDLFKVNGKWHAWTGCFIRNMQRQMANSVAETVNWLEGNPI